MKIKKFLSSLSLSLLLCFSILAGFWNLNDFNEIGQFKLIEKLDGVVADEATMLSSYKSNLTSYTNCRQAYFDSLTYNFGQNYKGSCGYVALGMLLSYYDTYLNDSIIPEQYDVASVGYDTNIVGRHNSPGILRDSIIPPNGNNIFNWNYAVNLDNRDYLSYMYSISEQSLHSKLITIGAERGYYDIENKDGPCATTNENRYYVLRDYLENVVGLTYNNDYKIEYQVSGTKYNDDGTTTKIDSNYIRNWTIQKIKAGYPVLVGADGRGGSHAFIAYDYDTESDKIYCHMGWGADTTHVTNESSKFTNFHSAMVIDFYLPHNHPQNYQVITTEDNKTTIKNYCFCSDEIFSIHNHSYSYAGKGTSLHALSCACGVTKTEAHKYVHSYEMADSLKHIAYCGCGASITESHSFNASYQKHNNNYHIAYCACGAQKESIHKYVTYNVAGHEVIQCSLCGHYKVGVIIDPGLNLMSIEEYLLSLYPKDENIC